MIVREKKGPFALLFAWRGSILPRILPMIVAVAVLSLVAVWVSKLKPELFGSVSAAPFSLIGLALSIFLSFRNSASYDRWWEGRRQFGAILAELRSLARTLPALVDCKQTHVSMIRAGIGFAYSLAARLRDADERAAAREWLPDCSIEWVWARSNVPNGVLDFIGTQLAHLMKTGRLDAIGLHVLETKLSSLSTCQAACERIRTTPLPFAYTLLLHRTAYLFCALLPFGLAGSLGWWTPIASSLVTYTFFGLDALGDELEEPFGLDANDLPLDALVRTIEVDLLETIGERPPLPLTPVDYVLK